MEQGWSEGRVRYVLSLMPKDLEASSLSDSKSARMAFRAPAHTVFHARMAGFFVECRVDQ
jgi:hypothetical protein